MHGKYKRAVRKYCADIAVEYCGIGGNAPRGMTSRQSSGQGDKSTFSVKVSVDSGTTWRDFALGSRHARYALRFLEGQLDSGGCWRHPQLLSGRQMWADSQWSPCGIPAAILGTESIAATVAFDSSYGSLIQILFAADADSVRE